MRTGVITRERLHEEGNEALIIYKTTEAYYVAHVNARGHTMTLDEARYLTYAAAAARLTQELHERS